MKEITRELEAGEHLLWSGRPKQGVVFRGSDIFMIPFTLLWCGIVVFWEYSAISGGPPLFFPLFGGVFVLIGLYMVFGRFVVDSVRRRKTFYGITNERIVIVSGLFQKNVKSLNVRTLSNVSLSEKTNGEGTILLGPSSFLESMYGGMAWPGIPQGAPKLESIQNAKKVYRLLYDAQRA